MNKNKIVGLVVGSLIALGGVGVATAGSAVACPDTCTRPPTPTVTVTPPPICPTTPLGPKVVTGKAPKVVVGRMGIIFHESPC